MKRFGFYPNTGEGVYINHRLIALVVLVRDQTETDREIVVYLNGLYDRPVTLTGGSATMLLEEIDPPHKA